ncbi:MAG: sporulation initiation inhibitor Soj [Candidatus Wallbacteria bacterium HGW-Wallbacteria-1]|jgi:chromosome partitioning protein|uniref:Sporulation initiation inhibitor Soj n=1 Tax=Candidatus Wallbacteria bacterium HGW-Wallbacteria-1 TaxID=2013854 RepID=A0A2N1PUS3_9BACT|nr:MAG: sporulation initiation inhibitor Soj [Candidatus Wallbacteria bacterium HGW-Wallbacteria-1]
MARVVALANQKGGVGKSTTAINLSSYLAKKGKSVLVCDVDPQGNATSTLGIDKKSLDFCMYDLILGNASLEDVVMRSVRENMSLVPATINLAGAEIELVSTMSRETRMKKVIDSVRADYDYILMDCPPSLGLLTINALTAADSVIIPLQCEYFALEGLSQLMDTIDLVRDNLNTTLEIEGIVLTMYDPRTRISKQIEDEVRGFFKEKVYKTIIPRNVRLSEAPSFGLTIDAYDGTCAGARAYEKLAKEVMLCG